MNPERSHILTVNLEDYFQVGAFNRFIQKNRWQRFESRIEVTTDRTLELLAQHGAKATFFVLGWIADQFPAAIRRVAEAGHEVAVRGYYHRRVREMTPDEFRADTIRARASTRHLSGGSPRTRLPRRRGPRGRARSRTSRSSRGRCSSSWQSTRPFR